MIFKAYKNHLNNNMAICKMQDPPFYGEYSAYDMVSSIFFVETNDLENCETFQ